MTRVMYDSVTVTQIPDGPGAVAGYVGGAWPTFGELERRFPHAAHLSIAVNATEDADCLDIENGDAEPIQAPEWVRRQHDRGVARPVVYASRDTMSEVLGCLARAGIQCSAVRVWAAHYGAGPHICSPVSCGVDYHADGTQWTCQALERNLDESLLLDTFFAEPAPRSRPRPRVIHRRRREPAAPRRPVHVRPHRKVAVGTAAGGIATLAQGLLSGGGTHIPAGIASAIAAAAAALAAYLTPGEAHR